MKLTNGCAIFGDKNGPQGSGTYFSINKVLASLRAPSCANLSTTALDTSVSITHEVNSLQTGLCCGCTRSSTIEVLPLSCYSEAPTDHNQPCDCCDWWPFAGLESYTAPKQLFIRQVFSCCRMRPRLKLGLTAWQLSVVTVRPWRHPCQVKVSWWTPTNMW